MISRYRGISPRSDLVLIEKLCERLKGKSFLHVNSTRAGGGVAEILKRMIPLLGSLGINTRWDVIEGDDKFFDTTKKVHNALQGTPETITDDMWDHYRHVGPLPQYKQKELHEYRPRGRRRLHTRPPARAARRIP
jgi:trehalose synthase